MPAFPVTVAAVQPRDVEVTATYAGRVRGMREVQVRARVGGILEQRLHAEGSVVRQGQALFQIERAPYAIALQQAEAELAHAQAAAGHAERERQRIADLFRENVVSDRDHDRAQSEAEFATARLRLAEATVAAARLNLDYTTVRAPISGPTSLEAFPEGSLIERGTLLTTIVEADPLQIRFSLPEQDAVRLRADRMDPVSRTVQIVHSGGEIHPRPGRVDFTDSIIDSRTGSVQARAMVDNPDGELVPGQFVRVTVVLQSLRGVYVIDPTAVGEGTDGPSVFILQPDNTVQLRAVRLGPVVDGRQVILEGLAPGEQLVINGHAALRPGMPVSPQQVGG